MSEDELVPSSEGDKASSADKKGAVSAWLSPDAPAEVKRRVQELDARGPRTVLASYQGPLPPAAQFAGYEEAVPGAGDRILGLAENEQVLRELSIQTSFRLGRWRIWGATAISALALAVAVIGHYLGSPWPAVPIGLAGFIGLIYRALKEPSSERD